jgi:hypothetical protein
LCSSRGAKKCIYIIYFHSLSKGITNFFIMVRVLVTVINKDNFLIFCLLTTLISQILKEEMINQLQKMRKEAA